MDHGGRCKKHPKHKQPAGGVCSICLTERLTKLAASNSKKAKNVHHVDPSYSASSSDVSSSYSTVSSPSSPVDERMNKGMGSRVFFSRPLGGREMFRSKSMLVAVENKGRPVAPGLEAAGNDLRRSGSGFWSKLMRVGSKKIRKDNLGHSKSVNAPGPSTLVAARY